MTERSVDTSVEEEVAREALDTTVHPPDYVTQLFSNVGSLYHTIPPT